ncbi:hypothetical protein QNH16_21345 [Peribacillus frigoritolerans]|nr:hypothetical protein [Peribacillus frigoritolerans]WHY13286.1 hypothetical protein QNH16_21345 [Peribacillus frigoritolerans]
MNENKVLLIGLIGFSLFPMGMMIAQWTVAGVVIVMGISSYQFASQ